MTLKQIFICISLSFILFGCGQDNSTSSNPTLPSQKITGTYMLYSASGTYGYSNGVLSFDSAKSISGTLILGDVTWNETYVVDGITYSKGGSSSAYSVNYSNGTTEGTIAMVYPDGAGGYSFSIDGYNLNLTGSPNSKWTKISDIQ
jgi:hypothetical protein